MLILDFADLFVLKMGTDAAKERVTDTIIFTCVPVLYISLNYVQFTPVTGCAENAGTENAGLESKGPHVLSEL